MYALLRHFRMHYSKYLVALAIFLVANNPDSRLAVYAPALLDAAKRDVFNLWHDLGRRSHDTLIAPDKNAVGYQQGTQGN
jgi:hypothetical protein